jgi:hypothetical protein
MVPAMVTRCTRSTRSTFPVSFVFFVFPFLLLEHEKQKKAVSKSKNHLMGRDIGLPRHIDKNKEKFGMVFILGGIVCFSWVKSNIGTQ